MLKDLASTSPLSSRFNRLGERFEENLKSEIEQDDAASLRKRIAWLQELLVEYDELLVEMEAALQC